MSTSPIRVAVIIGSRRDGRLAPAVAQWFLGQLGQRGEFDVDVVDLGDTPMPDGLADDAPQVVLLRPRLAAADAFVVIVPEYNRGIPGPLKTLIDCFNPEWEAKPFGFVGYGLSISGGVRATEHLRQVVAEFHSLAVKDVILFPRVLDRFDADGQFAVDLEGSAVAAKSMLDQLGWWALALREAKDRRPFAR